MSNRSTDREPLPHRTPEGPESGSTLLPMLIGGLVLIVLGSIVVMNFV